MKYNLQKFNSTKQKYILQLLPIRNTQSLKRTSIRKTFSSQVYSRIKLMGFILIHMSFVFLHKSSYKTDMKTPHHPSQAMESPSRS